MYLHDTNPIELPHVTIQMPVYKESLKAVIEPTIHSIKRAIATYELQGGTANIFVNDDGSKLQDTFAQSITNNSSAAYFRGRI